MLDFGSLRTPSGDGTLLLDPVSDSAPRVVARNVSLSRSWHFPLGSVDLSEVRTSVRSAFGPPGDGPLLVLGHQCEFIHPGVWAKHVAASAMANRLSGRVLNLVLDHDAVKRTSLSVPAERAGQIRSTEVPVMPTGSGLPFESIPGLNESYCASLTDEIRRAMGGRFEASAMGLFLDGFKRSGPETGFVEQMIGGRGRIDDHFGVTMLEHRVSRVWDGALLAHMICEAGDFAVAYNRALASYRSEQGIRGTSRPIADLEITGDRVELPLWCVFPNEKRKRVFVRVSPQRREVLAEDRVLGSVSMDALRQAGIDGCPELAEFSHQLRPKALMLTLWARLFLADFFIHGIGGAKYDRITDRLIVSYLGIQPPAMGCVSATLHLGLKARRTTPAEVREAEHQYRDVLYNPQRYLKPTAGLEELVRARDTQIAQSRALRSAGPGKRQARRAAFETIRDCNNRMLALEPGIRDRLANVVADRQHELAQRRLAEGREYFVGLYPRQKLSALADKIRSALQ